MRVIVNVQILQKIECAAGAEFPLRLGSDDTVHAVGDGVAINLNFRGSCDYNARTIPRSRLRVVAEAIVFDQVIADKRAVTYLVQDSGFTVGSGVVIFVKCILILEIRPKPGACILVDEIIPNDEIEGKCKFGSSGFPVIFVAGIVVSCDLIAIHNGVVPSPRDPKLAILDSFISRNLHTIPDANSHSVIQGDHIVAHDPVLARMPGFRSAVYRPIAGHGCIFFYAETFHPHISGVSSDRVGSNTQFHQVTCGIIGKVDPLPGSIQEPLACAHVPQASHTL